jgi:predicted amidohydrolase YtcJ
MNQRQIKYSRSKALVFLITATAFFASCKQETPPDLIIKNGRIITVDANFSIASALAIKGDKIIAVGTNKEIESIAGDKTKVIDVEGKTVIPGLIDAHAHPEQASISELHDAIPDPHTINELLEWVKDQASKKKNGEWLSIQKCFIPV